MGDTVVSGPRAEPPPVMVVLGVLGNDAGLIDEAVDLFGQRWGGLALRSEAVPFDQTDYYRQEMGPDLTRTFCCFGRLAPAETLAEIKSTAWKVERRSQEAGRRRVNLDPGYLDATKVVLASFKSGPHKIYLGRFVWADMVLYYRDRAFEPLPWSFPDLRSGVHTPFFVRARARYKALLRDWRAGHGSPAEGE